MTSSDKERVLAWLTKEEFKDKVLQTIGGELPFAKIKEEIENDTMIGQKLAKAVLLTLEQDG